LYREGIACFRSLWDHSVNAYKQVAAFLSRARPKETAQRAATRRPCGLAGGVGSVGVNLRDIFAVTEKIERHVQIARAPVVIHSPTCPLSTRVSSHSQLGLRGKVDVMFMVVVFMPGLQLPSFA
jgi:hypothetical protein